MFSCTHTYTDWFFFLFFNFLFICNKHSNKKMSKIRREAFKKLHRTRQNVFAGDDRALAAGRKEINDRFKANMKETDEDAMKKMLKLAVDANRELRTSVIQAHEKASGIYELRIRDETTRLDNVLFNPDAVIEPPRRRGKRADAGEDCLAAASSKKQK
ncbi:complex III assembly factor LYRM7 isoform 2-T2 [Glossina fuscipes fuscipes]